MKKSILPAKWIIASILVLGFTEITAQLVTIREFLAIFSGNELVIGILLANWLLISGFASYLGRKAQLIRNKTRLLIAFHIAAACILPIQIYIIRNLYNFAFVRGELIGITGIFISVFLVLLPICFITGFSFPLFTALYKKQRPIGKVYFFDSVSNIFGGIIFTFILVHYLNPFHIALIVLSINLVLVMAFFVRSRQHAYAYIIILVLVSSIIFCIKLDWHASTLFQQYSGQTVVASADSPYGRVVVTGAEGQLDFFSNGVHLFSTYDPVENEERVHYTLLQHPDPRDVLLISGGISGTTQEVLKYHPEHIDYVEQDKAIIALGDTYTLNLRDENITVYTTDARLFLRQSTRSYDAVIIDMPDPSTAAINRYYTSDFFSDLKQVLGSQGVVGLSISSGENYVSDDAALLDAAVYNSLKQNFRNVLLLPGDEAFMIASDRDLSYDVYSSPRINTTYINSDYIHSRTDPRRIDALKTAMADHDVVNRDWKPAAYYFQLRHWLGQFQVDYAIFALLVAAFIVFTFWHIRTVPLAVFTAGFAGIALEFIIIIGFQILYGDIFSKIGIIITAFMIGLAIGAWFVNRNQYPRKCISIILMFMFLYALMLPLIFLLLQDIVSSALIMWTASLAFPILTILLGSLVGALFPIAALCYKSQTNNRLTNKCRSKTGPARKVSGIAGELYFFDYAGAALGALVVSAVMVPLLGVFMTCVIVALVCLTTAVALRYL